MSFDLAAMARRATNPRRASIVIRDIVPPAVMATDLYRAAYLPIINGWTKGADRVIAEYERTVSTLTTDAPADVQAVIEDISAELTRLVLILTPRLRDWALNVERWQRGKWRSAVLSATGIDIGTIIGPETARHSVETAIEWNVTLVKDVSAQARQRIANAVFTGLREVKPAREVAKEIREAVAMSRRRSIGIASDQLSKLTSSLAAERRREAGMDTYKYRHSGKLHPRPWHKKRDGDLFTENPERVGTVVEGEVVHTDIPADDKAGVPPWCGCREQAMVIFE